MPIQISSELAGWFQETLASEEFVQEQWCVPDTMRR